jgi:lipopolysaccharide export system permease protein
MKVFHRYLIGSVSKIIAITVLLLTIILLLFDVFSHMDQYVMHEVSLRDILFLTLLYIPKAITLSLAPAALFATTYVLSMLHAGNEMIILANIGYSYRSIVLPVIVVGFVLVCMQGIFSEYLMIDTTRERTRIEQEVLHLQSSRDTRNVTLQDPQGNYVLHAKRYYDSSKSLVKVSLITVNADHQLTMRAEAERATFTGSYWVLEDVTRYMVDPQQDTVTVYHDEQYHNPSITLDPSLFRNLGADILTMDLTSAREYLQQISISNASQYRPAATDLSDRVFSNLTPLILMIISCSTVFTWRKNVLVLSIIASLAISVIYFVLHMLSMILAKQGILPPLAGPLTPMVVLLVLSGISLAVRRM